MTDDKKKQTEEIYKFVDEVVSHYPAHVANDAKHVLFNVLMPTLNRLQANEVERHKQPFDSRGMYLAVLVLERVHRKIFMDLPVGGEQETLRYIRGGRMIGELMYELIRDEVAQLSDSMRKPDDEVDSSLYSGIRYPMKGGDA